MAYQSLGELEQLAMLAVLRLGQGAYGTTIREHIEEQTGRPISIGSLYKALERLEGKGLVTSQLGEPTSARGGRAKKCIEVTCQGRVVLDQALKPLQHLSSGFTTALA